MVFFFFFFFFKKKKKKGDRGITQGIHVHVSIGSRSASYGHKCVMIPQIGIHCNDSQTINAKLPMSPAINIL